MWNKTILALGVLGVSLACNLSVGADFTYDPSGAAYNSSISPECKKDPEGCQSLLDSTKHLHTLDSFADFKELVESSGIRTVDQLLSALPEDFKKGYTLIYRSRALHQHLVTPTTPRVLMFGVSGNFMLTYNGSKEGSGPELLETIEFKNDTKKYVLREVPFDGVHSPFAKPIAENPPKCIRCHSVTGSSEVKAIWDQYNMWPGVYGSLSRRGFDVINRSAPEYSNFQKFLKIKDQNPRYAMLSVQRDGLRADGGFKALSDFERLVGVFDPSSMDDNIVMSNGLSTLPNQMLSMITIKQNFLRLSRVLMEMPAAKRAAYQYLVKGLSKGLDLSQYDNTNADLMNQWAIYQYDPANPNKRNFLKQAMCADQIMDFFPPELKGQVKSYHEMLDDVTASINHDYLIMKQRVLQDNLGLTRKFQNYSDPTDPFDVKISTHVIWDPMNSAAAAGTYEDATNLVYLFNILGLNTKDLSTVTNLGAPGDDVIGKYLFLAGDSADCFPGRGELKLMRCYYLDLSVYFDKFIPRDFYTDPEIHQMSCDQLAAKSRKAIRDYVFGQNQ